MSEPGLNSILDMLLQGDEDGWIQMLVLAVLIGLSAVSSFARQRKQKRKLEREERPTPRPAQPARRQPPSRAVEQRPPSEPARPATQPRPEATRQAKPKTIIRPGGALSQFVADIKEEIKRAAEEMQAAEPQIPEAAARPKPPEPAEPVLELEEPPRIVKRPAPKLKIEEVPDIIPQFADTDDLKRAILYLEILGKPVSLRDPPGQLIGP